MLAPLARIIARYGAGALVATGLLDASTGDQLAGDTDVVTVIQVSIGFLVMVAVEGYYWLAKKRNWTT